MSEPAAARGQAYRPCVGVALFNVAGKVWIGHRVKPKKGGALIAGHEWQMPQGGIDAGETPLEAAKRELFEETNVRSIAPLAEAPEWLRYDLPGKGAGERWHGRYRGQTQKWFAFRFCGAESEIDVARPAGGGHEAEFSDWRWERLDALPTLVAPFKREVYLSVAALFAPFART